MGLPSRLATVLLLLLTSVAAQAGRSDETALLTLWGRHRQEPDNHAAIAQDAVAFAQTHAQSPLAVVARGLAAWHWLKADNQEEARKTLAELLAGDATPMGAAGREMANRGLTRLDRESVKAGLRKLYAVRIEYPDTLGPLSSLPQELRPPLTDRWGTGWEYTPSAFKQIDAGAKQTFTLTSVKLGANSDITKALRAPYGGGLEYKPERNMPQGGKPGLVIRGPGGSRAALAEGTTAGDLSFPYFGEEIVVLSNGDYWFIETKPES